MRSPSVPLFGVARAALVALVLGGCADAGQNRVELSLRVSGSELGRPVLTAGDVPVDIDRAELAFGPLYLCAGSQAGDLCDTARLEWLDSVRIDLTNPEPQRAGTLVGTTGRVRSWMFDLAISSQLTRSEPFVLDAARELGGASLHIEGRAHRSGLEVPFQVSVVIKQGTETERGVPVVRKSTSDVFDHEVTGDEAGLWVRFDAQPWLRSMDLRPELTSSACEVDGDCAEPLRLSPDGQAYRGLHHAVVSGRHPELGWEAPP
jgi:hypothetical protein